MQAEFFSAPDNPVPPNAHVGFLVMKDGVRVRYARFAAEGRPLKGTVIIITGRNECIEKYFETIADLSKRGFGVAISDLRGQGASDRLIRDPLRGYINRFQAYADDLDAFFEHIVLPDCRGPYFVLAHSTGGLIAMLAAPSLVNRVQRMVICAPLLELSDLPFSMRTLRRLSTLLWAAGLGSTYMGRTGGPRRPIAFSANKLTTDFKRYTRNTGIYLRHPNLGMDGPTASWIRAVCIAIERVMDPEFHARLTIPTLFVAAGSDTVVSTPAIEAFVRHLRSASLVTIDGARHELLQEADIYREQFLAAFDAFIPGND